MTGKDLALSFLLVLICQCSGAQKDSVFIFNAEEGYTRFSEAKVKLGVSGGFGKYFQADLKKLNQSVQDELSFETEFTDNFPANFYYGLYLLFRINRNISAGPDYQFHTTGSRLAYSDYSGTYTFDQIISSHSVAIRFEGPAGIRNNPQLCISVRAGVNIASWRIKECLIVGEQQESSSARFDALRPFVHPAVKLRCRITPFISLAPSVGWNVDLSGKYHHHSSKDSKIDKEAGWSGPRAELSIDLSF